MSIAANKAVVQRFAEQMLSQHQLGVAADLFTSDFVDHDADDPDGRVSGVRGELPGGLAATGQQVDAWAWQTFRLVDGKIAEAWLNIDRLRLLQQLGALPVPA
jgi:predicted SnoaL-like aldol condensation-catalyzing enzyme